MTHNLFENTKPKFEIGTKGQIGPQPLSDVDANISTAQSTAQTYASVNNCVKTDAIPNT